MRKEICLCEDIRRCRESLDLRTRVVVLMHHRERFLTTNTARLASLVLPDCEIRIRGLIGQPFDPSGILEESRQPLFLYPSEDATPLSREFAASFGKPFTLIVPDGSWRQASKVAKREPFLKDVPRVTLPHTGASNYELRREPKEEGLATFEAIARALGFLEETRVQEPLEALFGLMVSRTLDSRAGIFPPKPKPSKRS
jgi:DTW domain-containing protein YfiP